MQTMLSLAFAPVSVCVSVFVFVLIHLLTTLSITLYTTIWPLNKSEQQLSNVCSENIFQIVCLCFPNTDGTSCSR